MAGGIWGNAHFEFKYLAPSLENETQLSHLEKIKTLVRTRFDKKPVSHLEIQCQALCVTEEFGALENSDVFGPLWHQMHKQKFAGFSKSKRYILSAKSS